MRDIVQQVRYMFSNRTRWPKPPGLFYASRVARPPAAWSAVRVSGAVEMRGKDSVGEVRRENATRQLHNPIWPHWPKGNRLLVPTYMRQQMVENYRSVNGLMFFVHNLKCMVSVCVQRQNTENECTPPCDQNFFLVVGRLI